MPSFTIEERAGGPSAGSFLNEDALYDAIADRRLREQARQTQINEETDTEEEFEESNENLPPWMREELAAIDARHDEERERRERQLREDLRRDAERLAYQHGHQGASKVRPAKVPREPTAKSDGDNMLTDAVRKHICRLMTVTVTTISRNKLYSRIRVNGAEARKSPLRLPNPLVLALRKEDPPGCAWNNACAALFVPVFIAYHNGLPAGVKSPPEDLNMMQHGPVIKRMFKTYVVTLKTHYKKQLEPPSPKETIIHGLKNSTSVRCNSLCLSRNIVLNDYYNELAEHLPANSTTLKICFSRENASEDDRLPATEDDNSEVFKIRSFRWRNRKLTEFLHAMDARYRKIAEKRKVNQLRERRVSSTRIFWSARTAPQGLPEDWYDAEWLARLKEADPLGYAELRIAPAANTDWDLIIKLVTPPAGEPL